MAVPDPSSSSALKLDYPWQYPELRKTVYPFRDEALSTFLRLYAEIDIDAGTMATEEITPAEINEERARLETELQATNTALKSDLENRELVARWERLTNDLKYLPTPKKDKLPAGAKKLWTAYRYSKKGSKSEDLAHDALLARVLDRFDADPGFTRYPKWVRYMVIHFSGLRYASAHGTYQPPTDLLKRLKAEELTRTLGSASEAEIETVAAGARGEIDAELATAGTKRAGLLRARLADLTAVETAKKKAFAKKGDEGKVAALDEMLGLERDLEKIDAKLGPPESEGLLGESTPRGGPIDAPRMRLLDQRAAIEVRLVELTNTIGAERLKDVRKRIHTAETTRRKAALIDSIERAQAALEALEDPKALMLLKVMHKSDAFPDWVWREIVRTTALRLEETDSGWEAQTPEEKAARAKKDPITKRWVAIMSAWKKDIDSWRAKHGKDLSLIVDQAKCDQIGEMALNARAVEPVGGIGQKTQWYGKGEMGRTFFRPMKEDQLQPGTSLFFTEWKNQAPTEAVHKLRASLAPDLRSDTNEVVKDGSKDASDCVYHIGSDDMLSRDCPIGTSADPSVPPPQARQWLSWKHEAIVVEVDTKHGRVITFETGPIGIGTRWLHNAKWGVIDHWMVYAGFAPSSAEPKDIDAYLKGVLPGR